MGDPVGFHNEHAFIGEALVTFFIVTAIFEIKSNANCSPAAVGLAYFLATWFLFPPRIPRRQRQRHRQVLDCPLDLLDWPHYWRHYFCRLAEAHTAADEVEGELGKV